MNQFAKATGTVTRVAGLTRSGFDAAGISAPASRQSVYFDTG